MEQQTHILSSLEEGVERMVDHVLDGLTTDVTVLIGPVVKDPIAETPAWYFVVVSGGKGRACRMDRLGSSRTDDGGDETDLIRIGLFAKLVERRPIVIHDIDDELQLARWAEAIWPGERTRSIREAMERERQEEGRG